MRRWFLLVLLAASACCGVDNKAIDLDVDSIEADVSPGEPTINDTSRFVVVTDLVPEILVDLRYYGSDNFVGHPIDGYQQEVAILTREAALALKKVSDSLQRCSLGLKIYDAYRPARAVRSFAEWAREPADTSMKQHYYPRQSKGSLFANGYLSRRSNHCHGSTVDLTLVDLATGQELDMGTSFDLMDESSHYSYDKLSNIQSGNRRLLRQIMVWGGFSPIESEWWHFRLKNEPYMESFDFPVNRDSI